MHQEDKFKCMCAYMRQMFLRRHGFTSIKVLDNMVNILSSFIQLGVKAKLGAAIDMSKHTPYDGS
jgi:hypothetical protein